MVAQVWERISAMQPLVVNGGIMGATKTIARTRRTPWIVMGLLIAFELGKLVRPVVMQTQSAHGSTVSVNWMYVPTWWAQVPVTTTRVAHGMACHAKSILGGTVRRWISPTVAMIVGAPGSGLPTSVLRIIVQEWAMRWSAQTQTNVW